LTFAFRLLQSALVGGAGVGRVAPRSFVLLTVHGLCYWLACTGVIVKQSASYRRKTIRTREVSSVKGTWNNSVAVMPRKSLDRADSLGGSAAAPLGSGLSVLYALSLA